MGNVFFELTVIICLAAVFTIVFRALKQPLILAYILTGVLISGPFPLFQVHNTELLRGMGEFGITLLLFMLGLELKLSELKSIGKTAVVAAILQIGFTFGFGFLLSELLQFSLVESVYLGIAVTFSSTIIVVKLLSDKKDLASLYGKLVLGILLVQDFFAIITLVLLSGFQSNQFQGSFISLQNLGPFGIVFLKALILFGIVLYLSRNIFPRVVDIIARSQEALFLVSIAFAFGMAALVSSPFIGFSLEIGGLLAGLALANSTANFQIIARVRALRDFFITLFFVFLGTEMHFQNIATVLRPALILSAFVLIYKPLIVMAILGFLGYRKRTAFLAGINLAQVSEFSLILIFLGLKLGHVEEELASLITVVSVITFVVSNYLIVHAYSIYKHMHEYFDIFERKITHKENMGSVREFKNHIVLIGVHRMGESVLESLKKSMDNVLVVDFDPDIAKKLKESGTEILFGDISDSDIQEKAQIEDAKLVISTVPDIEDNIHLVKALNHKKSKAKIIVMAQTVQDAKILYKIGADYVILPHLLGGKHLAKIIKEDNLENIDDFKSADSRYLN